MSELLDRITKQFQTDNAQSIEVPEWGREGVPFVVYFTKATLQEMSTANRHSDGDPIKASVRLVALKALDKGGKRLFSMVDTRQLMESADPQVLLRIATAMAPPVSSEELEKN